MPHSLPGPVRVLLPALLLSAVTLAPVQAAPDPGPAAQPPQQTRPPAQQQPPQPPRPQPQPPRPDPRMQPPAPPPAPKKPSFKDEIKQILQDSAKQRLREAVN